MRVALVAPPFIPVPPPRYGGTELFLAHLAEGLREQGIDIVLYSNGESKIKVENRWLYPTGEWPIQNDTSGQLRDLNHSSWAIADAERSCDLIHVNSTMGVAFSRKSHAHFVCTLHHPNLAEISDFYRHFPWIQYVAISRFQAEGERLPLIRTIHHGLDVSKYRVQTKKQDYFCFLGRFAPIKGAHLAIEVAKRSGIPLKMAGEIQPIFRDYFETKVKPHIDGKFIEYVGEADLEAKNQLLGNAKAMLFPILWDEPFGLVMIEAMACGTPVLALTGGAVPEVVRPGLSGEIALNLEELVTKAKNLKKFDPRWLHHYVEQSFSVDAMTRKYIALYRELTGEGESPEPEIKENVELRAA